MNATLVVANNQIQLVRCSLYAHYCVIVNAHHICPQSWWVAAGVPVNTPMANGICPNCHMNVHAAIDGIIQGRDISLIPLRARALADQAFIIAQAYGLTPKLTL